MKVLLKFVLDCEPEAAWRALQSPTVFREVSAPLLKVSSREPGGFQTVWPEGENRVEIEALGLVPLGIQIVDIDRSRTQHAGVRIVHDKGHGVSGALKVATTWDHRMAVAADPAGTGKTLYRDRLIVKAGALTPALWASLWAFWQLRGVRLQQLAPTWAFDPEFSGDAKATAARAGRRAAGRGAGTAGNTREPARHAAESPAQTLEEPPTPDSTVLGADPDLAAE